VFLHIAILLILLSPDGTSDSERRRIARSRRIHNIRSDFCRQGARPVLVPEAVEIDFLGRND
jgi:hypothetical protein